MKWWWLILAVLSSYGSCQEEKFTPTVTAACKGNLMSISVTTEAPFYGLVISRDIRNNSKCFTEGSGQKLTPLTLNMEASINDPDYCAVSVNVKTGEKKAQIAVRQHKTLELADDKLYVVSCGNYDSPPPSSPKPARMYFIDGNGREVKEVVKDHAYKLRIATNQKHFRIRNCFAFTTSSQQVPLFDQNGCPEGKVVSRWVYSEDNSAESTIFSMFRFQDSRKLSFQCYVLFCDESTCPKTTCSSETVDSPAFYNPQPQRLISSNDTDVIASVTVSVLEPGDKLEYAQLELDDGSAYCPRGSRFCPTWLLWLTIALGVLFLLMLLVNGLMCAALTCTCSRTELIEKDPSIMEDYDPYRSSWAGSQYGNNSRYSQNQKQFSDYNSDHYAMPGSRPGSRYSNSKK